MKSISLAEKDGFADNTSIVFSPGLNVFIGANGIGTTYLLDLIDSRSPVNNQRDHPILMYDMMCEIADIFRVSPQGRGAEEMHKVIKCFATQTICVFDDFADYLSPRQSKDFTQLVSDWCVKYNTQVICATHTPGVLDALCLAPERDKLFALDWRSDDLRVCTEINPSPELIALNDKYPLSQLWPMGNIGAV